MRGCCVGTGTNPEEFSYIRPPGASPFNVTTNGFKRIGKLERSDTDGRFSAGRRNEGHVTFLSSVFSVRQPPGKLKGQGCADRLGVDQGALSFPEIDCDRIVKTAGWKFFLITLIIEAEELLCAKRRSSPKAP